MLPSKASYVRAISSFRRFSAWGGVGVPRSTPARSRLGILPEEGVELVVMRIPQLSTVLGSRPAYQPGQLLAVGLTGPFDLLPDALSREEDSFPTSQIPSLPYTYPVFVLVLEHLHSLG